MCFSFLMDTTKHKNTVTHDNTNAHDIDTSSAIISTQVNETWFSSYAHYQQLFMLIEANLNTVQALFISFVIRQKPTSVKTPTVKAILKQMQQIIMVWLGWLN